MASHAINLVRRQRLASWMLRVGLILAALAFAVDSVLWYGHALSADNFSLAAFAVGENRASLVFPPFVPIAGVPFDSIYLASMALMLGASLGVVAVCAAAYLFPYTRNRPLVLAAFCLLLPYLVHGSCLALQELVLAWRLTQFIGPAVFRSLGSCAQTLEPVLFSGFLGAAVGVLWLVFLRTERGYRVAVATGVSLFLYAMFVSLVGWELDLPWAYAMTPQFETPYLNDIVVNASAAALLMIGAATLPQRAFRIPGGICRACAYDLDGLAQPTCPECGTSIPTKHPT